MIDDETMSQEQAFMGTTEDDNVFKFDPVEGEDLADSQSGNDSDGIDLGSSEGEDDEVAQEEQRIPYSRFKKKIEELEAKDSLIHNLEERLTELENYRQEPQTLDDLDVPREWVELYGDSDASKRAFAIQLQREQEIEERATRRALDTFRQEAQQEEQLIENNEEVIEENLASLQEELGRRFTPRQEEAILSIVDEFSPVGPDGKYVTLFPFDKAYEIYEMRSSKANQKTSNARSQIAGLTSNSSSGEDTSSGSSFKRGWDSWRENF